MASDAERLRSYEEDFREEFLDELTSEMRKSFEERAAYLKLRENQASG